MPRFQNIYCIIKLSEFDYHNASDLRQSMFNRLNDSKREQIRTSRDNQTDFIAKLKKIAGQLKLDIHYIPEKDIDTINPSENDLVISCGGDGTFLSCAQQFENSVLLGMNSDYKPKAGLGSFGALTSINRLNLESHLQRLIHGDFFIDKWKRLQVKINDQLIDRYGVNDIYFGQKISYQTCDITLHQSGIEQDFNCSGILCCTGMGSHAWYYNAGGSPFSNDIDAFGFRVLFPNLKRPLEFSSGIVSSRNELIMVPEGEDYILSFDSKPDVITTQLGDEIRVFLAPNKAVKVISFYGT
ncbi:NAD(+)/NADH kinase [bacterium]|nr:NAD(+)/NADH kinase [bacterium]